MRVVEIDLKATQASNGTTAKRGEAYAPTTYADSSPCIKGGFKGTITMRALYCLSTRSLNNHIMIIMIPTTSR